LADRDKLRFLAREVENGPGYETIVKDHVRLAEKLLCANREQPRIARTGAHYVSFPLLCSPRLDTANQFVTNQSFGVRDAVRQDVLGDRAVEETLPEATPFLH